MPDWLVPRRNLTQFVHCLPPQNLQHVFPPAYPPVLSPFPEAIVLDALLSRFCSCKSLPKQQSRASCGVREQVAELLSLSHDILLSYWIIRCGSRSSSYSPPGQNRHVSPQDLHERKNGGFSPYLAMITLPILTRGVVLACRSELSSYRADLRPACGLDVPQREHCVKNDLGCISRVSFAHVIVAVATQSRVACLLRNKPTRWCSQTGRFTQTVAPQVYRAHLENVCFTA